MIEKKRNRNGEEIEFSGSIASLQTQIPLLLGNKRITNWGHKLNSTAPPDTEFFGSSTQRDGSSRHMQVCFYSFDILIKKERKKSGSRNLY